MSDIPSISELEKRMRPGAYSRQGFLGQTESLEIVLAQDSQLLKTLGVSHEQIASALENVLRSALEQQDKLLKSDFAEYSRRERMFISNLYQPESVSHFAVENLPGTDVGYLVEDRFQVFIAQYRGLQECPWECEYDRYASFDFLLLNRKSGKYVTGPGLIVHLISKHHFFEGMESPYRVDPARVAEVFEFDVNAGLVLPDCLAENSG